MSGKIKVDLKSQKRWSIVRLYLPLDSSPHCLSNIVSNMFQTPLLLSLHVERFQIIKKQQAEKTEAGKLLHYKIKKENNSFLFNTIKHESLVWFFLLFLHPRKPTSQVDININ